MLIKLQETLPKFDILEVHEICVQHYAGQLMEYLLLNVTQWDTKCLTDKVQQMLEALDATRSARFRHEHLMAKVALTKFQKTNRSGMSWMDTTCQEIWTELRGITNGLAQGMKKFKV